MNKTIVNIIKEELLLEESLRKKIEFICGFTSTTPTIINGSNSLDNRKIIINNVILLAFNYSNEIFIKTLSNKTKLLI